MENTSDGNVLVAGPRFSPKAGAASLCGVDLIAADDALEINVVTYSEKGDVRTLRMSLGDCQPKHAKDMRSRVEAILSQPNAVAHLNAVDGWFKSMTSTDTVVDVLDYTPYHAIIALTRNLWNRPVQMPHLNRLMSEVTNNKWGRAESNMCFDVDGNLSNGQHRNHMIIMCGVTIRQSVAFGHDGNDIDNFDRTAVRSAGDALGIHTRKQFKLGLTEGEVDLRGLPPGKDIDAIATALAFMETNQVTNKSQSMTYHMVRIYREDLAWLAKFTQHGRSIGADPALIRSPYVRACLMVAHHRAPKEIDAAITRVLKNDSLSAGTPLHSLHDLLSTYKTFVTSKAVKNKAAREKYDRLRLSTRILAALDHYLNGNDQLSFKSLSGITSTAFRDKFKIALDDNDVLRSVHGRTHSFLPGFDWVTSGTRSTLREAS